MGNSLLMDCQLTDTESPSTQTTHPHYSCHSNSEALHKNTHSSTPMDRPTTLSPSHNEEDEKQFTDFLFGELETDTPAVHPSHSFHLLARSQEGEKESRSLARSRRRNGFRVPGK